ncbi:hypothetical protein ALC57_15742 [Trachymyrmex cornetzi]|uniref:Uncharacterized protein n=1 Tax=Trachymyrmex cornetzi TaxID=471704 RepID=A0A151IW84_9HYME|nr:hypothetical protein ALC57_15742 [Trachymyrmex cornetzi]
MQALRKYAARVTGNKSMAVQIVLRIKDHG